MVSTPSPAVAPDKPVAFSNVGFLTVLHEASGFVGGYLVINLWGRPLEFRLSSAVQPNRVQQILYAGTLETYVCGDLIGKALVDKASVPVQLIVTDREAVLDVRHKLEVPVLWLAPAGAEAAARSADVASRCVPRAPSSAPLLCHPRFLTDVPVAQEMLARLDGVDLAEPFTRIREAIGEARKMGVTNR
jgi:hypothetical protein